MQISIETLVFCQVPSDKKSGYSGRAPLAPPLFSAPLPLAHLLSVQFYLFYLTKSVLLSAPPPLAHLLGVPFFILLNKTCPP